jgi:hypothetical protein
VILQWVNYQNRPLSNNATSVSFWHGYLRKNSSPPFTGAFVGVKFSVHYTVQISLNVFIFWPVSAYAAFLLNRQCNHNTSGKTRTFKPRKDVPEGTKQYQLRKYAEATLVSLSLSNLLEFHTINGFAHASRVRVIFV